MGVPNSEVGYIPAMPRREDHEVHMGHVVTLEKNKYLFYLVYMLLLAILDRHKK
jgi:hypothetical protein